MFRRFCRFIFTFVLLLSIGAPLLAQGTSLSADLQSTPENRARAAIALALANGHDVSVDVATLADVLTGLEGMTLDVDFFDDSVAMSAGEYKRYSCEREAWYIGIGLGFEWWADTTVSNGRITRIRGTDWNWWFVNWLPTLDAQVNATATGYIEENGAKIRLLLDGTIKYYFAGTLLGSKQINLRCTKNA